MNVFEPKRRRLLAGAVAGGVSAWSLPAWSQFRVEVSGVGLKQIPFAFAPFRGAEGINPGVAVVASADLERSGQFRAIAPVPGVLDENARPDLGPWRDRSVDVLVTGSVTRLADGRYDVRFRVWDVVSARDLSGLSFPVAAADLRLAAHRIADFVYEKLIGEKGVFSTRLAYVSKNGPKYTLWVADADGENAQSALNSPEPIISPAWAPNGSQLAYVSFEARKPVIYSHDVATGKRRLLANFKGSNSAPCWSPDGRQLAMTLSFGGNSQIYLLDANGGEPRRLTQTGSIDTEPVFSPDGRSIYFVSDRGGSPQIYRMDAQGRNPERVTFNGSYNISPTVSPDGRWLVFVSRINSAFKLHAMELANGNTVALTDTQDDESPSFAPNGRLLIYATRQQGREALMTTTLDGKIKTRLASAPGDIREPAWGPFTA
jgi:TolB protein